MDARILRGSERSERATSERCFILELSNSAGDSNVSIARARVEPGVATELHRLRDTAERYVVLQGQGTVEVGDLRSDVAAGDVVLIPPNVGQRIENTGDGDLVFLCVCTPRFTPECYESLEDAS